MTTRPPHITPARWERMPWYARQKATKGQPAPERAPEPAEPLRALIHALNTALVEDTNRRYARARVRKATIRRTTHGWTVTGRTETGGVLTETHAPTFTDAITLATTRGRRAAA